MMVAVCFMRVERAVALFATVRNDSLLYWFNLICQYGGEMKHCLTEQCSRRKLWDPVESPAKFNQMGPTPEHLQQVDAD
jgi:hypothetical protein